MLKNIELTSEMNVVDFNDYWRIQVLKSMNLLKGIYKDKHIPGAVCERKIKLNLIL